MIPPPTDLDALSGLLDIRRGVLTDLQSCHRLRADAASEWMREDDGELRADFSKLMDALPAVIAELTQARSDLAAKERRIEALEKAAKSYAEGVVTVLYRNSLEWLEGLADETNELLEIIGETDRIKWNNDGECFSITRATLEDRG